MITYTEARNSKEFADVQIAKINFDQSPAVRGGLDSEYVAELVASQPPEPWIYDCGDAGLLIADGLHRIQAASDRNQTTIRCKIFHGTPDDCLLLAGQCNLRHGKRRSEADKSTVADTFLKRWPMWADARISAACGVDEKRIKNRRYMLEHTKTIPPTPRRLGSDDKMRDLPTTSDTPRFKKTPKIMARKDTQAAAVRAPDLAAPLPPPPAAVELDRDQMAAHLATAERWIRKAYAETGNECLVGAIQEVQLVHGACQLELPGMPLPENTTGSAKSEEEVVAFCLANGISGPDGVWFWRKCKGCGWKNAGRPMRDWKMTLLGWHAKGNIFPSQTQALLRNNGKPPEASLQQKIMNEKIQRAEKTLSKLGL